MSQRFTRCPHCGLPHPIDATACPITGRPIEARRSGRPPERKPSVGAMPQVAQPTPQRPTSVTPPANEASIPPPPPLVGQLLGGKYRAIRVLGEGGMGSVYECENISIHRKVAVKVLHPAQARKKASVQRFHHEAQVAGAIGHPNICEIYDMGELEDGSPFLVMELLTGQTLADRVASEGALPFDDVVEVITQVLSGLIAAHEKGIIHRDIKPENVFLAARPGIGPLAKLLDFGISKVAGGEDLHLTRTGMVMGTPYYMSPEQARGDRALDHRVDIYATGVMMYECLTGRRPFTAANYNALLVQILTTSPRPIRELRPAIPEGFEECVSTAMNRDRERRYRSAADMQRALNALRDPAAQRKFQSVAPEPLALMQPKGRAPASDKGRPPMPSVVPPPPKMPAMSIPKPSEGPSTELPISVEPVPLGPESDSGSIEIPIVAEEPKRESRPLYRPPPESAARPTASPRNEPRRGPFDRGPEPSRANPPISRPVPRSAPIAPKPVTAPPVPRAMRKPSRLATPPPQAIDAAQVRKAAEAARHATGGVQAKAPPPMPEPEPPWLADPSDYDPDPTQVGAIPQHVETPIPRRIDPDQTERIEPQPLPAALIRPPTARPAREVNAASAHDPRREESAEEMDAADEEVPTTLFERRAVAQPARSKTPQPNTPRATTTERAPAPEQPTGAPPAQFPRRG